MRRDSSRTDSSRGPGRDPGASRWLDPGADRRPGARPDSQANPEANPEADSQANPEADSATGCDRKPHRVAFGPRDPCADRHACADASADGGFTDIELISTDLHVIVEAKRGWEPPPEALPP